MKTASHDMESGRSNLGRTKPNSIGLFTVIYCSWLCSLPARGTICLADEPVMRAAMCRAVDLTPQRIAELKDGGKSAISILLEPTGDPGDQQTWIDAAGRVRAAQLELYYWIEVARCPALADAHPKWMASQQTHPEWRRLFADAPSAKPEEVVKTYPWVPILSRETFAAQLERLQAMLADLPAPDGVFLNDLQGAPSACGCGNPLCRWTSDYGKRRSTLPLGADAAALFISEIKKSLPNSEIIPVWTTECEAHDGAKDGLCAGVGCFEGICWKSFAEQLAPVEQTCKFLAVLAPYKLFHRDLPIYQEQAGWVRHALKSLDIMPRKYDRPAIKTSRLIAVLQGWDVDASEIAAQIRMAEAEQVRGYVVAYVAIDQSWEPKLVAWP